MRPAAHIKDWMSQDEMLQWIRESPDKASYRRRMAIWLTYTGRVHAHKAALMLGVSTQSIWAWISRYNTLGPKGLIRQRQGGRKWAFMSINEEKEILLNLLEHTKSLRLPGANVVKSAVEEKLGKKVSLPYIYKLLKRNNWPGLEYPAKTESAYQKTGDSFKKFAQPWKRKT